ncbi:MAG: succinate dehydrogenase assembly factor 2 [Hyphomicrobiales bacterium]|jgi:antitoxin CptB
MKNEFQNKLIYRSWHRGTKELDLILGNFIEDNISDMKESEIKVYEDLLASEDPEIYNWIVKSENPPNQQLDNLIKKIRYYLESNNIDVLN